ncbi:MAG TPA: hypothetical protein VHC96_19720 [Puia sp.]|jgi:hypothetical protein|nr:hypothetical protein [Puia sp.]
MKAMKSQAIAFLLGFSITSLVLFFVPGVAKKTSQVSHPNGQKLAVMLHDSTAVR